jgi:hypothetical protein
MTNILPLPKNPIPTVKKIDSTCLIATVTQTLKVVLKRREYRQI